jgi:hypothetical protein
MATGSIAMSVMKCFLSTESQQYSEMSIVIGPLRLNLCLRTGMAEHLRALVQKLEMTETVPIRFISPSVK